MPACPDLGARRALAKQHLLHLAAPAKVQLPARLDHRALHQGGMRGQQRGGVAGAFDARQRPPCGRTAVDQLLAERGQKARDLVRGQRGFAQIAQGRGMSRNLDRALCLAAAIACFQPVNYPGLFVQFGRKSCVRLKAL
ncbi:hypothetical protein GCM10008966_23520 [Rhodovulum strictum]